MLKIYSLRDNKMNTYLKPVFAVHLVQIQRDLVNIVKDQNSMVGQHPSDFELCYIGEYDESTAEFKLNDKPEFVMNCNEFNSQGEKNE